MPDFREAPENRRRFWRYIATAVVFFGVGTLTGYEAFTQLRPHFTLKQIRESDFAPGQYKYTNPLLSCEVDGSRDPLQFDVLKSKLNEYMSGAVRQGKLSIMSVYFDTRDGRWFAMNPDEKYFPASLMKVPTMLAILKAAEKRPELLQERITYDGTFDYNVGEYFKPAAILDKGRSYTIDELVEHMIVDSDNNALYLLNRRIDDTSVWRDLGLPIPNTDGNIPDFIAVKSYAQLFRVLYNATYLSRDMSEHALDLLSKPDFPQGLMAGVPSGTIVAQKFGEHVPVDAQGQLVGLKELHDCGVVYHPANRYLVCVMTKGQNLDDLAADIKDVSKIVYDEVSREYSGH